MRFLRRHPFPVVARFDRVVAVSFAFPEPVLAPLIPAGLEIDSYEGFGFVTVAMVWARHLRPAGFPACLGQDFFLAGYRVFAKLRDSSGRRLRGLRILRSETDRKRMVWLGNLMTGYRYRLVRLQIAKTERETRVRTSLPNGSSTLDLSFEEPEGSVPMPDGSPFHDWRMARRFAGPMPFTFSPRGDGSFVVIEGNRQDWTPRPIVVNEWEVGIFDEPPLQAARPILANAFAVRDIDYRWQRGRIIRPGGAR